MKITRVWNLAISEYLNQKDSVSPDVRLYCESAVHSCLGGCPFDGKLGAWNNDIRKINNNIKLVSNNNSYNKWLNVNAKLYQMWAEATI